MCQMLHNVSVQKFQTEESLLLPKHASVSLILFLINIAKSVPTSDFPSKALLWADLHGTRGYSVGVCGLRGRWLFPRQLAWGVHTMYQGKLSQVGTEISDKLPAKCRLAFTAVMKSGRWLLNSCLQKGKSSVQGSISSVSFLPTPDIKQTKQKSTLRNSKHNTKHIPDSIRLLPENFKILRAS